MKVLKTGFYIDYQGTIWTVLPNSSRYFLFAGKWLKSYSNFLGQTRSLYLGDFSPRAK